ncbi:tRNA epoxyqueuosine(34) reductase QueG [bacterium]|nr:tRNA epoxyqueuosine(34) reductase QueG [bacterium]
MHTRKLAALDRSPALDAASAAGRLKEAASLLGLTAGIARAELPREELERLRAWLARGDQASMSYMEKKPEQRASVGLAFLEGARSVLAVALPYPPERDPKAPAPIAAYARGEDYHRVLARRLDALASFARDVLPGARARRFVDTAPVLERAYAHAAGLGFYGKNSCLIHPRLGSYFFVGGLALDRELPADGPLEDAPSCGTCTLCLEACPTRALPEPFRLDSRRCISYLTIEHRGAYPEDLRPLVGERVFGCDVCQAVCPWNEKFAPGGDDAFSPFPVLQGALTTLFLRAKTSWKGTTRATALPRALKRGFLRNLATAMGSSSRPEELPALEELSRNEEPSVREHALWALARRKGN